MSPSLRLFLLTACSLTLSSCGTANHFLNQANGMLRNLTEPARGILRVSSDTPAAPAGPVLSGPESPASIHSPRTPAAPSPRP